MSPIQLEKLHLNVHLGFGAQQRKQPHDFDRALFRRCLEHVLKMGPQEAMIAFVYKHPKYRLQKLPQMETLRQMRMHLQDRMASVMGDGIEVHPERQCFEPLFVQMRKLLAERGFIFGPDVDVEAWGETGSICVPTVASHAYESFQLSKPVTIKVSHTNWFTHVAPNLPKYMNEQAVKNQKEKPGILYLLDEEPDLST